MSLWKTAEKRITDQSRAPASTKPAQSTLSPTTFASTVNFKDPTGGAGVGGGRRVVHIAPPNMHMQPLPDGARNNDAEHAGTHSLTESLTHSLTESLTHSLTESLTHSLTH